VNGKTAAAEHFKLIPSTWISFSLLVDPSFYTGNRQPVTGNRNLKRMLQPSIYKGMWISKSTSVIGDMTKENYFSIRLTIAYPIPREIRPQSHLKTSVVVHKCN